LEASGVVAGGTAAVWLEGALVVLGAGVGTDVVDVEPVHPPAISAAGKMAVRIQRNERFIKDSSEKTGGSVNAATCRTPQVIQAILAALPPKHQSHFDPGRKS
jgi:hypothetical protein